MSSPERDASSAVQTQHAKEKKNQKPRACDYCRRKKIRCNGAEMPDKHCSRCKRQGIDCTYEPINTRPPSKSYVQVLESRLQNMEKLLEELHPNVRIPKDFDNAAEASHQRTSTDCPSPGIVLHFSGTHEIASAVTPPPPDSPVLDPDELEPSDDEQDARRNIFESLTRSPSFTNPTVARYHGKSSNILFLHTVVDMKQQLSGDERPKGAEPVVGESSAAKSRTPEYGPTQWLKHAAATAPKPSPYHDFPPSDLMERLVDAYFMHYNLFVPVLHRPTFEQGLKDGLHFQDRGFGAVVLLVCANASRVVDDPRVYADGTPVAGWQWYEQVEGARWSYLEVPCLEDLQTFALIAMYFWGSNVAHSSWTILGLGLRMAQDMGAHRKKMYKANPNVKDELLKRAFWSLLILDRVYSFGTGRPCGIHDEDLDADPLLEVDDEYWISTDPGQAFKQPEGKPSYISFANCLVRLLKIMTFASRTIYSINKSRMTLGMVGPEWEQKIVAELDSSINKWIDLVPPHLKWDPDREDHVLVNQSASLYAWYYLTQICIHRPFIQSPRKRSPLTLPSLAICTNAARACTHVLGVQLQRTGTALVVNRIPLFTSGLVLLLNFWAQRRSGLSGQSTVSDIHKCMEVLKELETHTNTTKKLWGVLDALVIGGPSGPTGAGQSDPLTDRHAVDTAQASDSGPVFPPDQTHAEHSVNLPLDNLAAVAATQEQSSYATGNPFIDPSFAPHVHTEELGNLPFHHGLNPLLSISIGTYQQCYPPPFDILTATQPTTESSILPHDGALQDAAMDTMHFDSNAPEIPMRVEDLSELLSIFTSSTSSQQHQPSTAPVASAPTETSESGNTDVSMLSAENMTYADNMMEVWSTAPTSFDWAEWEPYIANITGVDQNSPFDPPGPPSVS